MLASHSLLPRFSSFSPRNAGINGFKGISPLNLFLYVILLQAVDGVSLSLCLVRIGFAHDCKLLPASQEALNYSSAVGRKFDWVSLYQAGSFARMHENKTVCMCCSKRARTYAIAASLTCTRRCCSECIVVVIGAVLAGVGFVFTSFFHTTVPVHQTQLKTSACCA